MRTKHCQQVVVYLDCITSCILCLLEGCLVLLFKLVQKLLMLELELTHALLQVSSNLLLLRASCLGVCQSKMVLCRESSSFLCMCFLHSDTKCTQFSSALEVDAVHSGQQCCSVCNLRPEGIRFVHQ